LPLALAACSATPSATTLVPEPGSAAFDAMMADRRAWSRSAAERYELWVAQANGLPDGLTWQDIATSWQTDGREHDPRDVASLEHCVWRHSISEADSGVVLLNCSTGHKIFLFHYCPATGRPNCDAAG